MILSQAPTFGTLRAFVHASPQLHCVYVRDRLAILRDIAERTFDGFVVDVNFAYETGTDEFQQTRSESMIEREVGTYGQRLAYIQRHKVKSECLAGWPDLVDNMSLDDIIPLVRFHRSVIEPLTERYAAWALGAFSSGSPPQSRRLSGVEQRRIHRALYRLEVFCNVCGSKGAGRSALDHIGASDLRRSLLSYFPAWQTEEILCIHAFAQHVYSATFYRLGWDLDGPLQPEDIYLLDIFIFSPPERRKHSRVSRNLSCLGLSMLHCRRQLLGANTSCLLAIYYNSLDCMLRQGLTLLSLVLGATDDQELFELMRQRFEGVSQPEKPVDWIDERSVVVFRTLPGRNGIQRKTRRRIGETKHLLSRTARTFPRLPG